MSNTIFKVELLDGSGLPKDYAKWTEELLEALPVSKEATIKLQKDQNATVKELAELIGDSLEQHIRITVNHNGEDTVTCVNHFVLSEETLDNLQKGMSLGEALASDLLVEAIETHNRSIAAVSTLGRLLALATLRNLGSR